MDAYESKCFLSQTLSVAGAQQALLVITGKRDASYLRLKNIQIGYRFPARNGGTSWH